jgi:hypothetical protein
MARFGERPSGSANQGKFISWLQRQFARIPGMRRTRSRPRRLLAEREWQGACHDGALLEAGHAAERDDRRQAARHDR